MGIALLVVLAFVAGMIARGDGPTRVAIAPPPPAVSRAVAVSTAPALEQKVREVAEQFL